LIHAVELSRDVALWNLPVSFPALGYLYATGIAACFLGYHVFRKLRPAFADVV
jgi:ABC-type polysaccharide/polyol phosphate export permease